MVQRVGLVAALIAVWLMTALWQERTRLCDDAMARRGRFNVHNVENAVYLANVEKERLAGERDVSRYCLTWIGLS